MDDDFTLLHVIIMLLVDTFIYLTVTWYVEGVYPGDYGVPQPWYFPLMVSKNNFLFVFEIGLEREREREREWGWGGRERVSGS